MPCSMLLFSVDTAQKYGENMYLISKRCIHVLVCTRPSLYHSNLKYFSKDVKLSKISCFNWNSYLVCLYKYGNMGCWVFKGRIQNWKDFCIKINILKGNYWILRIGQMGSLSSLQKSEFLKLIILIFHEKKWKTSVN